MSIPFSVDSLGKSIPIWLCDLNSSLWNILEGGNFITEYLPGENKLVVHTDRLGDEPLGTVKTTAESYMPDGSTLEQYNHHIEVSWRDINKYAECTSIATMEAVNPDFKNDLTSDGEWVYPLEKIVTVGTPQPAGAAPEGLFRYGNVVKFSGAVPNLKSAGAFLRDCPLKEFNAKLPKIEYITHAFNNTLLTEWTVDISTVKGCHGAFMNSKLKRFKSELPYVGDILNMFANTGLESFECDSDLKGAYNQTNAFFGCQLDKKSALSVLSKNWSGVKVTIGIHIDHKTDEEVLVAIDAATAKGWTLTVQWNGTATASTVSTLSLMDEEETDPIYARIVEEPEYGDYVTSDGTRVIIDWGHIITSPDGKTPEEMGYAQYVSIGEVMYKHNLSYHTEPIETDN